jgi:hypothetical protein
MLSKQSKSYFFLAGALTLVAVLRIVGTYSSTSQAFDEPCHVAAGIEFLDKGTYTLDPVHPPLSRIAIGLPLYLAGERFPRWSNDDRRLKNYNEVGNSVLYNGGRYLRNLSLARLGVLPFFVACAALLFMWTSRQFGGLAALIAVGVFTTTPTVLAFAGLAYSDMTTACMQCAAIFAFIFWLERPSRFRTVLLGLAAGLALASKLTSIIFLGSAGVLIAAYRWYRVRREWKNGGGDRWLLKTCAALVLAILVLWCTYGFQVGRIRESMGLSTASMPSFQHFPKFVGAIARECIVRDCVLPAPAFVHGLTEGWILNKSAPPAYLLGSIRNGGWWYFFLAAIAFKTPISFLILFIVAVGFSIRSARRDSWTVLAPAIAVAAILLVTMPVKYNAGLRHVLVVFPLMSVVAGYGAALLMKQSVRRQGVSVAFASILLAWQTVPTFQARHDYISYFNAFAGADPSHVLVNGCDLDCGQDVFRLRDELERRKISQFHLAMWSSADINNMGLPKFEMLPPSQPVAGWIAISDRSRLEGEVFHNGYPADSFRWLDRYSPVSRVGDSIDLYYIPETSVKAVDQQRPF